jgi:hypothetical protein
MDSLCRNCASVTGHPPAHARDAVHHQGMRHHGRRLPWAARCGKCARNTALLERQRRLQAAPASMADAQSFREWRSMTSIGSMWSRSAQNCATDHPRCESACAGISRTPRCDRGEQRGSKD